MLRETYMMTTINFKKLETNNQGNSKGCTQIQSWRFSLTKETEEKSSLGCKVHHKLPHCKTKNDHAYDLEELWLPMEYVVSLWPDDKAFGRPCQYINDPTLMSNLN